MYTSKHCYKTKNQLLVLFNLLSNKTFIKNFVFRIDKISMLTKRINSIFGLAGVCSDRIQRCVLCGAQRPWSVNLNKMNYELIL